MKTRVLHQFEAAPALVGASVLCSMLAQRSFTQQSELASEIICWAILPFLFRIRLWPDVRLSKASTYSGVQQTWFNLPWAVAVCVTVSTVFKAENGMAELSPFLTPLLVLAQNRLQPANPVSKTSSPSLVSPLLWGATLSALLVTLPFSRWGYAGYMLSAFPVLSQFMVYMSFLPREDPASRQLPPLADKQQEVATFVCPATATLLTLTMVIETVVFGFAGTQMIRATLVGIAKALSWLFILQTRRHVSWSVAAAIQTFSVVASYDSFWQPSGLRAAFNVVASALALAQVVNMLPRRAKSRSILWVFILASLAPYVANLLAVRSAASSISQSYGSSHKHPVDNLVESAKTSFETLVQRQSTNYLAAQDEYRRRYKMDPPDGFEDWFKFAKAHESPIIDDFDTIYQSISSFLRLSGSEISQIMDDAHAHLESELWSCTYSGSGRKAHCHHRRRAYDRHISSSFSSLLGNFSLALPNVKFLVNHLDEPRSLLPPKDTIIQSKQFTVTDMSHQPVWNAITKHCSSGTRRIHSRTEEEASTLPFVMNASLAMDLCRHPEFQAWHGIFMGPTSFRLVEGLVPIFSTGSLSTMGDILYPSPAYFETEFQYDQSGDVDWEEKQNNLYWAGSTTGGFASDYQWQNYHRQRFVSLAQNLQRKSHMYLREINGVVQGVASRFLNRRLFDVAFTKIFQCKMRYCRAQRAYFKMKPWADKFKPLRSKLAFDMDGNGISGRYYQLLASKSAPLKQTLIREWHDDRLIPWAHFIPVSQSMEELPELVSYLTSEMGQQKARQIAELGREWHSKAFREIDFSIYVYRLLLEMARLQDPKRERYIQEN